MDYILDTNIILTYIRQSKYTNLIDRIYNPLGKENTAIVSVVSVGEIKSLAIQNKWGNRKLAQLEVLLNQFAIADINVEAIVEKYAEIDAFSQGKLPYKPSFFTARNMGKNDLWIAATAYVLNAQLLTTDKDFDHLKDEFLSFERIQLPQ